MNTHKFQRHVFPKATAVLDEATCPLPMRRVTGDMTDRSTMQIAQLCPCAYSPRQNEMCSSRFYFLLSQSALRKFWMPLSNPFTKITLEVLPLKKINKARPRRTVLPVPFVKRGVSATVVFPALPLNFVPSRLLTFRAN